MKVVVEVKEERMKHIFANKIIYPKGEKMKACGLINSEVNDTRQVQIVMHHRENWKSVISDDVENQETL